MESFSLQGINLSSIPAATMSYSKPNNNSNETTNPANACVNAINKYAQEKSNTQKTMKQQLIELKREEEKKINEDTSPQSLLEKASLSNQLKGKRSLELAFDVRIELVKGVKSTLEVTKEQSINISSLINKYEEQLKQGGAQSDYASKALHLLDNISKQELSNNLIQEPMYQVFNELFDFYDKYSSGGASNQLKGLGDNITVESLGLNNIDKNSKEFIDAIDKAIVSVDNVLEQVNDKYKSFFDKRIETTPKTKTAKSCDDIEKWLAYSIEHNELNNDMIGYSKMENKQIIDKPFYIDINKTTPQYKKIDIYMI